MILILCLFGKEQNYNAGCPKHCRIRTKGTGQIQGGKPGRSDLGLSLAGLHPSNEAFLSQESERLAAEVFGAQKP